MGYFLSILLAGVISHGVCSDAFAQVVVKKDQLSPFSWETPLGPKVGLVLSGGGARGIFQIGVIKALEEHDVPIHFIVGTSMGSIVGGLYAAGYSVPDLERLAKTLNWQELLALEGDIARSNVFLSQKKLYDRTLISLELDGWKPRIPLAVSTGQKLTTKLNELTLQGVYHPNPSFDQLKFPFRSVATNLATGKKYIFDDGSLMESMRASMAFPLLFTPYEIDGTRLVDGGVLTNIPADVAREAGCDIVISVDATGTLRPGADVKAPWHTVDQVVAIMMKLSNQMQLNQSDIVISSQMKDFDGFDFTKLDTIIQDGYLQAQTNLGMIDTLLEYRTHRYGEMIDRIETDSLLLPFVSGLLQLEKPVHFQKLVRKLGRSGWFQRYDVRKTGNETLLFAHGFPEIKSLEFFNINLIPQRLLNPIFKTLPGKPLNNEDLIARFSTLIRLYRDAGFALAKIDSFAFNAQTGNLSVYIDEGYVTKVDVTGNDITRKTTIFRESNVSKIEPFRDDKISTSLDNLTSTDLFNQISLLTKETTGGTELIYRVKEKSPVFLRAGLYASETYHTQYMLNLRNENLFGAGNKLGVTVMGGDRNFSSDLQYRSDRLLESYFFTQSVFGYESLNRSHYSYQFSEPGSKLKPKETLLGETNLEAWYFSTSVGRQFAKFGEIRLELTRKYSKMSQLSGFYNDSTFGINSNHLTNLRIQTIFDSRDDPTITRQGQFFDFYYENSNEKLFSDVTYNKMYARLETTFPFLPRVTLTPSMDLGSADIGLPIQEFFMAGGSRSFYGFRDFDLSGRQLFISHLELRWFTPTTFIFDIILHARYDLGNVWQKQETIKISDMKHALGFGITFATPIGPVNVSAGRAFRLFTVPNPGAGLGPIHIYLNIGHSFF